VSKIIVNPKMFELLRLHTYECFPMASPFEAAIFERLVDVSFR
jgi:hypothetical protein